jgi:hypothetical protein
MTIEVAGLGCKVEAWLGRVINALGAPTGR